MPLVFRHLRDYSFFGRQNSKPYQKGQEKKNDRFPKNKNSNKPFP